MEVKDRIRSFDLRTDLVLENVFCSCWGPEHSPSCVANPAKRKMEEPAPRSTVRIVFDNGMAFEAFLSNGRWFCP